MNKDMEKIYENFYRDNDKYSRIYGIVYPNSSRNSDAPHNERLPSLPDRNKKVARTEI